MSHRRHRIPTALQRDALEMQLAATVLDRLGTRQLSNIVRAVATASASIPEDPDTMAERMRWTPVTMLIAEMARDINRSDQASADAIESGAVVELRTMRS